MFAVGIFRCLSYYFNASYCNNDNRLEFIALGSPQFHGQNFWNNRISNSQELALEMGVAEEDLEMSMA